MKTIFLTKTILSKAILCGMLLMLGAVLFAQPVARFSSTAAVGCAPILVQFTDESTGQPTGWKWDLGNGTTSYLQHPSATYFTPGEYQVKLVVKNSAGADSLTRINYITVYAPPVVLFAADQVTGCGTVTSRFTTPANASIMNRQWDFGDGILSSQENPVHTYTQPGAYNVTLTLTNNNGCAATLAAPAYIRVNHVKADFAAVAETRCNTQRIQFKQLAGGNGTIRYVWYFGNGDSSTLANPTYNYATGGTYSILLVVSNQFGCTDSLRKNITVVDAANATFSADRTSACSAPAIIQFSNQPNGNTYLWDFGDSTFSTASNPQHRYTDTGRYHVKLVAKNIIGCLDSMVRSNYIQINKPFIILNNLPDSGCAGMQKQFSADISNFTAGSRVYWNFGDGNTSTLAAPQHVYNTAGYHTVSLIVTNSGGCSDTTSMQHAMRISSKPVAGFTSGVRNACAGQKIFFTDESTGNVTGWEWDFGDNNQSVDRNPAHTFTDTGFLSPRLIAYNGGCADTIQRMNYMYLKPAVSRFKFDFTCSDPSFFSFSNFSLGANSVTWDFGDGNSSTNWNTTHRYTDTGSYRVSLTAVNNSTGCSYYQSKPLKVVRAGAAFNASDTAICKGGTIRFTSPLSVEEVSRFTWDFGDGKKESTLGNEVTHRYDSAGIYSVTLSIHNLVNCRDSLVKRDYIHVRGPSARFAVSTPVVCANSEVVFQDSTRSNNGTIASWSWNYGNGNTATQYAPPFTFKYNNRGNYRPMLTVTDAFGCADSFKLNTPLQVIQLDPVIRSSDSVYCLGQSSVFVAGYGEPGCFYQWYLGDGSTATGQRVWHAYPAAGIYDVKMVISNTAGCSDSSVMHRMITVAEARAAFTLSDSFRACPPLMVQFNNQSLSAVETLWEFGDGTSTNVINPSHFYAEAGEYIVTLTIKGRGGCVKKATGKITVKGPRGNLQYGPLQLCGTGPVNFTAQTTDAVSLIWDFNDGTTVTGNDSLITHQFNNAGKFMPKLLLSDAQGCLVPVRGVDTINVVTITAGFSGPALAVCGNDTARFQNSSACSEPLSAVAWNFGDGAAVNDNHNPVHRYLAAGDFYPSLSITSASGCTDSLRVANPVRILPFPQIRIAADSAGCVPFPVAFAAAAEGAVPVTQWQWEFGNGQTSNVQQPLLQQYAQAGNYSVELKGRAANGCAMQVTKTIRAWAKPSIRISGHSRACAGEAITLTASGANQYQWVFTDGISCNNCTSVTVTPVSDTRYQVNGTDSHGCTGTDSFGVSVIEPFQLQQTNQATCAGTAVQLQASGALTYNWSNADGSLLLTGNTPAVQPAVTTVYRVVASGEQGCFTDTGYTTVTVYDLPEVNAGADLKITSNTAVDLVPELSANIARIQWFPTSAIFRNSETSITVKPLVSTEYTVKVTSSQGCIAQDKVWVTVIHGAGSLFLPNTFSPNNDGNNDVFYPRSEAAIRVNRFKVFNRAGIPVFEKTNFNTNDIMSGWTGQFRGVLLPSDAYMYAIEWVNGNGETVTATGNVSLVR